MELEVVGAPIMQVQNQKNGNMHQKATSRLSRPVRVNLMVILLVLILLIAVPVTVFLSLETIENHRRWYEQEGASQRFMFHLREAADLLNGSSVVQLSSNRSFENDEMSQQWFSSEMFYTEIDLQDLYLMDTGHQSQLYPVVRMVDTLRNNGLYLLGMNATERSSLTGSIKGVANNVVVAYWNYLNYTSESQGSGPPFWYFGPSPPDEKVLQEAADVANQITLQVSKQP
jgi:hypothetical protein